MRKKLHAYRGVGRRQLLVQLRLQSVDIVPDEGRRTEEGDGRFDGHCNQKRLPEMVGKMVGKENQYVKSLVHGLEVRRKCAASRTEL
jgi:hypothetical protein